MKKLIFSIILLILATVNVSAQKFHAGGSLGLWYESGGNTMTVTLSPELGYHLNEKWAIGSQLGMGVVTDFNTTSYIFTLSPYARYTCFSQNAFSLFVDGSIMAGVANGLFTGSVGVSPGLLYKVSDNFALYSRFGFLGYKYLGGISMVGFDTSSGNLSVGAYLLF
ncbi:MAG TPA: hypothetical protein PLJ40_02570 [Paludibacteraceae bacterium]|jgi:hypothetical protein|nr:hypothetical protein [Paludibacteraceae bacterium]HQB68796.1 hypothetical protein [Paludibacteraceae bacterium]HRS67420.1 hypothetical protein [Paludibacteraceae bacterium]